MRTKKVKVFPTTKSTKNTKKNFFVAFVPFVVELWLRLCCAAPFVVQFWLRPSGLQSMPHYVIV